MGDLNSTQSTVIITPTKPLLRFGRGLVVKVVSDGTQLTISLLTKMGRSHNVVHLKKKRLPMLDTTVMYQSDVTQSL